MNESRPDGLASPISIADLRAGAEAHRSESPQYRGTWDRHVRVIVTKRIVTKMGLAFEAGDVTMAEPGLSDAILMGPPLRSVYSRRNHIDTLIEPDAIQDYPG